jgi:outer membrane receptor for ferrienterochelin and colicin
MKVALAEAPLEVSEEMVITGFATSVKRKNLANAVATISEEKINQVSAQTIDGALSAKFAGVTVSANNGAPGGGFSVNLRGISTINGSGKPLYWSTVSSSPTWKSNPTSTWSPRPQPRAAAPPRISPPTASPI